MAAEKDFENRVKRWLESEGVYAAGTPIQKVTQAPSGWYFKVWGGGLQKSGIPDLILNVNGIFLAVELKSDTGRSTDLQRKNIAAINESSGVGIILYPDGFERFKTIIKGVKQCKYHIPALSALKAANSSTSCAISTNY